MGSMSIPNTRSTSSVGSCSEEDFSSKDPLLNDLDALSTSDNRSSDSPGISISSCPARLESSGMPLEPAFDSLQHSQENKHDAPLLSASMEGSLSKKSPVDKNENTLEKLQMIRMKFLRTVHRLGEKTNNAIVAQVLYRLGLAEQIKFPRNTDRDFAFSNDRASAIASEHEATSQEDLDFTCTILVLGKTGVGKSATINSIFNEVKAATDAFQPATKKVAAIVGTVHGIQLRIIDTPGLIPSFAGHRRNEKIMSSVKKFVRKYPPDLVLYVDRLDMQNSNNSDFPVMKIITKTFGAAIWHNACLVLTHCSSTPPDGPDGIPLSYEIVVAQRLNPIQLLICQTAGDARLMVPVSLVENHQSCQTNRAGERVLPNGQVWKPHLLLLCFASKVLGEANAILKLQDNIPGRPSSVQPRVPPLSYLLSFLLRSRAQPKMPDEQVGAGDEFVEDFEYLTDSEGEDDFDKLPLFKPLTKSQLNKLSKEQRKDYFNELDYREKLFQRKQWKEELRRQKNIKSMPQSFKDELDAPEDYSTGIAAVPVPMPDMPMPPSFDSDNPTYRYRCLDIAKQWVVRPVMNPNGWDHDCGYDGLNAEKTFVISNSLPVSISGQINKDKQEANMQLECATSLKHREGRATLVGFDVQTVGKDQAYTLCSETRFNNFRQNMTLGRLALMILGDTLAAGIKLEDRLRIRKRLQFVVSGAMVGHRDLAFGGTLEATLRDKDYPIGKMITTLGFSIMDWHGDLAMVGNLQSQFSLCRNLMMVTSANINNRRTGQVSIRTCSSDQLHIALIGIVPIIRLIVGAMRFNSS